MCRGSSAGDIPDHRNGLGAVANQLGDDLHEGLFGAVDEDEVGAFCGELPDGS
jgi:hypothetical protein